MKIANFKSQTIWTGDNLEIMRGMNSGSVDLIYLDPPFNSKTNYAAPIGSVAAGAEFKDTWTLTDIDTEWINLLKDKQPALHRVLLAASVDSDKSYLVYMAVRLLEMHRLMKDTSSIFLHCDPTMSHYLKLVMDAIFGRSNFRNEIIWCYGGRGMSKTRFQRKHDIIFYYGKSKKTYFNVEGASRPVAKEHVGRYNKVDEGGRRFARVKNRDSTYSDIYLQEVVREDWWEIPFVRGKESTGYPTQKPLALLERIIKASTNEGDMVLDPFCGCATTCVSADALNRGWVGIDISAKAAELVAKRIDDLYRKLIHRTDIPERTDLGPLPRYNARENRTKLYGEQQGNCNWCGTHFEMRHFEVDHIIAKSKGGTDHISNLQLLCGNCNRRKGDRGMKYLRDTLSLDRLKK